MKALVFNLLVVGALAFMLFDGDPPTSVSAAVQKVAVKTEQLVEKGKALMGEPTVRPRVIPTSSPKPTPEPVGAPVVDKIPEPKVVATTTPAPAAPVATAPAAPAPKAVAKTPAAQTPRPVQTAKAAAAPAPALSPQVARRRAEVLGETTDGATQAPPATPDFMAPRVRRNELNKLAEDMELMFVEKVTW